MEEVINTIKRRYIHERAIYTWCGIALVAVNPYQEQDIYSDQVVETYHSASHSVYLQLDPHIYAVTEDAYSKLELNNKNQSIIVSGESGAGKTVSAKHAMRYLASIASSHRKSKSTVGPIISANISNSNKNSVHRIEQRVLASNPIMEAIGNARTSRNDNSSRFGKYIQIYFDKYQHKILGANMRTYLLEKSRVTKQQAGERNFHIFYQLLNYAQRNPDKTSHLHLLDSTPDGSYYPKKFNYLNTTDSNKSQNPNGPVDSNVASPLTSSRDDLRRFNEALRTLNIDDQRIQIIYRIIAGILHGGNIEFKVQSNEENEPEEDCPCSIDAENDFHFKKCCELIGLDPLELSKRLTLKLLRSGSRDIIEKPQNRFKAEYSRDAMLKFIYECFFTWLVALINISLGSSKDNPTGEPLDGSQNHQLGVELLGDANRKGQQGTPATTPKSPSAKKSILDHLQQMQAHEPQFIGVLDIYGFENFKSNSFEQFCINYANEVLQQQYNQHVFKIEQEEYIREGIDWTFIEYSDNQPVIDVIESRPIGILNLLDEECKMPKGSDRTWCAKLYDQLLPSSGGKKADDSAPLKRPKINSQTSFIICHYAEDVNYNVETFLEKNRDALAEEQCEMLRASEVLNFIFEDPLLSNSVKPKMRTQRSATVGWQFRGSLAALIKTLNATEPHYVRCIKPNDEKKAFNFNEKRAIEQLRACGVYETIRISNNGFPSRWLYKDFARRYCVLIYGTPVFEKLAQRSSLAAAMQEKQELDKEENQEEQDLERAGSLEGLNTEDSGEQANQAHQQLVQQKRHFMYQFSSADVRPICEAICRIAYDELDSPYKHLRTDEEQEYIDTLIERHGRKPSAIYQFGKSKLFFRAGQVAYLERIRSQRLRQYSVTIQRHIRGWLARKSFILRREAYYEQLRREATLASLQEQALLQAEQEAARQAAELAANEEQQRQQLMLLEQRDNLATNSSDESSTVTSGGYNGVNVPKSRLGSVYYMLVDLMYTAIQPLIISAVLEYEALDQPEPFSSLDSHSSSRSQSPQQQHNEQSMENLIKELDRFHDLARKYLVPEDISVQAFKQIFYLICAHSLNQLLIRRDLCQFRKAMQINFNLSCLVQWCREHYLVRWKEIVEQLDPITQATKLLQTRKSSDDIATIEEVCNKLRPSQIIKILNLYTSSYEEQITTDFIHELEEYLIRIRSQRQFGGSAHSDGEQGQQSSSSYEKHNQPESLDDENNNNSGNNFNQNDLLMDTKHYFSFEECAQ